MRIIFAIDKTRFPYINQLCEKLEGKGIECFLVDDLSIYEKSIFSNKILKWVKKPKKFLKIIKEIKPDLIFTERTSHFASLSIDEKIPLIIFLRGDIWKETEESQTESSSLKKIQISFKKNIMTKCFKNAQLILPICDFLTNIVEEKFPDKKIRTLYQGINEKEWFLTKNKKLEHPCVGLVQNANLWNKAQEMLVLKDVLKKMPDVIFYWAGDGPYREKILSELGKFENFKWLGALKYPDEVRDFLSEIDVYALISGLDMSPHSVLEAQLMKKPVIATDVGGIPELIKDKDTGFLVSKGNSQEIIEKITFLIDNKDEAEKIGEKASKVAVQKFEWDVIAEKFIEILKENELYNTH